MRKIFKLKKRQSFFGTEGFTIFDMVVALALIAVVSTLIVANYSDFRQTTNLEGESEKLTSLIRKAQLWALSGQTRGGTRPPGGWGVYIEQCDTPPCRILLYADMLPASPPNHLYDDGNDDIVAEIFTQQHVQIQNVTPALPSPPYPSPAVDLAFTSPTSTGYINGDTVESQAVITFFNSDSNQTQSITVDRSTNRISLGNVVVPPSTAQCADGIDNDGDLKIDLADPECGGNPFHDSEEFGVIITNPPEEVFIDYFEEPIDTELTDASYAIDKPPGVAGWQQLYSVLGNNQIPGATLKALSSQGELERLSCGSKGGALYETLYSFDANNTVEVLFSLASSNIDYAMIATRIQNDGDMYLFEWSATRGRLYLHFGGAWLQLGEEITAADLFMAGDRVSLKAYGNVIGVYRERGGVTKLLINERDNNLNAPGKAGVGLGAVITRDGDCYPQRLDDFKVWENVEGFIPQCNDLLDNDGDGAVDYNAIPGLGDAECNNLSDDSEDDSPSNIIPVFYDDFNAINSDTVLDSGNYSINVGPIIGTGWTQIVGGSGQNMRADVNNDWLEDGSCGSNEASLYRIDDTLTSDYEVSVSYAGADNNDDYSIIAARIQNSTDMYAFQWSTTRGQLYVGNGGTWTQLGGNTSGLAEDDQVTLKVEGNNISVLQNGVIIRSATDSTHSSAGYAGVGMGEVITNNADCSGQELDNFKVIVP